MRPTSASATWQAELSCHVVVAGHHLGGNGWIDNGTLALLATTPPIPTLTVADIFHDLVNAAGGTATWPASFIDLTFAATTVYYCFVTPLPAGLGSGMLPTWLASVNEPGLQLGSQLQLEIDETTLPAIDVQVGVVRGGTTSGLTIDGEFAQPISLCGGLITLSSETATTPASGPRLSVDSTKGTPTFGLQGTIEFLGESVGATLAIAKVDGASRLSATLTYDGTVGPFSDPSLSVSWTKAGGLIVDGFPVLGISHLGLDFESLLSTFLSSLKCAAPSIKSLNHTVHTHVAVSPQVATRPPAGMTAGPGAAYLILNGSFQITAEKLLICTVALPTLAIAIPEPASFGFGDIVSTITSGIVANADQLFNALWNNKPELSKFLAVFLGAEGLKKALNDFASQESCSLNNPDTDDGLDAFEKELSAEGSSVGDSVGAALAAGASAAVSLASSAVHAIASICGGSSSSSGSGGGSSGGGAAPHFPAPVQLPAPSGLALSIALTSAPAALTCTWSPMSAGAGYFFKLIGPGRKKPLIGNIEYCGGASYTAALPSMTPGELYGCFVQALGDGITTLSSPWSSIALETLAAPTGATLAFGAAPVAPSPASLIPTTVTCAAVSGAPAYVVRLASADPATDGAVLYTSPPIPGSFGPTQKFSFSVPAALLSASSCAAEVQALGGSLSSVYMLASAFSAPSPAVATPALTHGIGDAAVGSTFAIG